MQRPRLSAALAVVVLVAFGWYQLQQPLALDQGVFAWAGHVLVRGGMLYRDVWDIKGPFAYYVPALGELVFGRTPWGLRAVDLIWQLIAVVAILRVVIVITRVRWAALLAVVLYVAWYLALDYQNTAQPDGWAGVLIAVAVAVALDEQRGDRGNALVGLLIGIACLVKPTYAVFGLIPLADALANRGPDQAKIRAVVIAALSATVPLLFAAAAFAIAGGWQYFWEAYFGYTWNVYRLTAAYSWPQRIILTGRMSLLSARLGIACLATTAGLVVGRHSISNRHRAVLGAWLAAALVNLLVQGKIVFLYQWLPLYVALAVTSAVGVVVIAEIARTRVPQASLKLLGAIALVGVAWPAAHQVAGSLLERGDDSSEFGVWGRGPRSLTAASHYIVLRTNPGQYVFFTGNWIVGNFLADRPSPTRFAVARAYLDAPSSSYAQKYQDELLHSLALHPPAYVVTPTPAYCRSDLFEGHYCVDRFAMLAQWLNACYRSEIQFGEISVWKRTCRS